MNKSNAELVMELAESKNEINRLIVCCNEHKKTIRELTRMLDTIGRYMAAVSEYAETGDPEDLRL